MTRLGAVIRTWRGVLPTQGAVRALLKPRRLALLIWALGLVFFAHHAQLQLASDDIGWLKGEMPTVFDEYRLVPRLLFMLLYRTAGPDPSIALGLIFLFHSVNMFLVYSLARAITQNQIAALAAAWIFMINPITLGTLTWVSCLSYVLGATLALLSLFFFWKGLDDPRVPLWWAGTITCYVLGLFSSHELLFLPAIFLPLSWLHKDKGLSPTILLTGLSIALGLLVNFFFYRFERFGVESARLLSLDFISAFASSALSFGFSLAAAYPLSFFIRPTGFLELCFSEPARWILTLGLLASILMLPRASSNWRPRLGLILSFVALITPFILRLYLMPPGVNYDISYILSGRVFYLPFVMISILAGQWIAQLYQLLMGRGGLWVLAAGLLLLAAYLHAAFILYAPQDFRGLSVLRGTEQSFPTPWNPYHGSQPLWLTSLGMIAVILYVRSTALRKMKVTDQTHNGTGHL